MLGRDIARSTTNCNAVRRARLLASLAWNVLVWFGRSLDAVLKGPTGECPVLLLSLGWLAELLARGDSTRPMYGRHGHRNAPPRFASPSPIRIARWGSVVSPTTNGVFPDTALSFPGV
jgi:hypothetical protein